MNHNDKIVEFVRFRYNKETKLGYYRKLWLCILIVLVPFIIVSGLVISGSIIGKGYEQFTTDLYQSVKDGVEAGSLRVEYNGESTRLTEKNAFNVVSSITSSRFKNYKKDIEITGEMFFDFGNGDSMWLYSYDNTTMLIKYTYADGEIRTYITTEITRMVTFERLVSIEWGNSLWNE